MIDWQTGSSVERSERTDILSAPLGLVGDWTQRPNNSDMAILRVVLVERMALLRQSLTSLLRSASPNFVVRPIASLADAIPGLHETDLLLADHLSCETDGIARLRTLRPDLRIVLLTSGDDRGEVVECLRHGANGVVSKAGSFADVQQAIRLVMNGRLSVPDFLATDLSRIDDDLLQASPVPPDATAPAGEIGVAPTLTNRQRDVLRLLATGKSTKDIARSLDLAVSTVKVHLAAIYRALGARNRVDALCRAGSFTAVPMPSGRFLPA